MKERSLYNDEFERQLREKADQFKMYPSDKVWNEVHQSLHARKKRFVVGMSFLIGGILFIAGKQLIFPAHNAQSKLTTAKINTIPKPAETASLPSFTAGSFEKASTTASADRVNSDDNQNTPASFVLRSGFSSDNQGIVSGDIQESIPEKMQSSSRLKSIKPAEENITATTTTQLDLVELKESMLSPVNNITDNPVTIDKTASQFSHNHNDRFSWEIYATPTFNTHYLSGISYRSMVQAIPTAPIMVVHIANVNGFVDNTPVLGYNVGGNILYRISKNISLKAGLEFSFSRYYLNTYNSNPGQASATLSSYFGYVADSLSTVANGGGSINKNPERFQNKYYQLSVPVGVDVKVLGKSKFQLHLGATLQPSYLLNTDAYVLSDDYSSYTKDPSAYRRWNLIAGAEAYISYGVGKIRWEIGPQVRYQIFSTYKNSYPLQENMLNYGIRIGISKSIW